MPPLVNSNEAPPRKHILLDVSAEVASRLRLLIIGPMLAGIAAYGVSTQLPIWYTSTATLSLKETDVLNVEALMRSNAISDVVIKKHPELAGDTPEAERRQLMKLFRWTAPFGVPRKSATLFNLEVDGRSPKEAQAINNSLIDTWLQFTKPRPDQKVRLEAQLARSQEQLLAAEGLIARLEKEAPSLVTPSSIQGELATAVAGLRQRRDNLIETIATLKISLEGGSRDVILAAPSLPVEVSWPRKGLIAAVTTIAAELLLLIAVGMHSTLRSLRQDDELRPRVDRLMSAFRRQT